MVFGLWSLVFGLWFLNSVLHEFKLEVQQNTFGVSPQRGEMFIAGRSFFSLRSSVGAQSPLPASPIVTLPGFAPKGARSFGCIFVAINISLLWSEDPKTKGQRPKTQELLDFHPQLILNILLVDLGALFRRFGFVGHSVQFDHCPAAKLHVL